MTRSVLIVQPRIPQFRVDYFNGIIALARSNDIHIVVAIPRQIDDLRKDEMSNLVPHLSCKRIRLGFGKYKFDVMHLQLKKYKPDLIVMEHAMRTFLIFVYLRLRGYNVALWGHGTNYTSKEFLLAKRMKEWLVRQCYFYFVYTQGGLHKLLKQGMPRTKIHVMNNTIPNPFLLVDDASQDPLRDLKDDFIREHDLENKKLLIFIGGLDGSKRLDFLMQSFEEISILNPQSVLLIFGEGPDKLRLQRSFASSKVIFLGSANLQTKIMLAKIGACILMPGRVGLIAVDSFQMKLPIITTNYNFHAPEYEYLIHGKNSLVSEDNIPSFVELVTSYLQDEKLQINLKLGANNSERDYRLQDMQEGFVNKLIDLFKLEEQIN
jgi:glycosyltransferase involved in cell wall biosynthesis